MRRDFDFLTADQQSVSNRFAYVYKGGGHPIRSVEDIQALVQKRMLPQKPVHWTPPDAEWQAWIDQQWWGKNNLGDQDFGFDSRMFSLRDKLLSFGGAEVCLPAHEENLDDILAHGQLWWGV